MKRMLSSSKSPRVVKLRGLLKGLRVKKDKIEAAKKSLFKYATS